MQPKILMIVMFNSLRAHTPQSLDLNPYEMLFTRLFLTNNFLHGKEMLSMYRILWCLRSTLEHLPAAEENRYTHFNAEAKSKCICQLWNALPWKTDSHSWIMSSCNPCSLIKWGYALSNSQDWEKLFKIPKWCSPGKTLQNNTNGIWYICQGTYCREDTANEICFILLFLYFSGICSHVYESDVMNGWLRVDCTVTLWPVKQNLCQSGCRRDLVPEYSTSN